MRAVLAATLALGAWFDNDVIAQQSPPPDGALRAFEVVRSVLQHPRCQNCHIPGDAPLQGDDGHAHEPNVVRGPNGRGGAAMDARVAIDAANVGSHHAERL